MTEQIIIGLFTIGGTIAGGLIGGLFSVRSAKIGYKREKMEKDIRLLANQVKSYWYLEAEYLSQIEKLDSTTPKETVKRNTRKFVENNGNDYPNMTASEANSILKKYE